MSQLGCGQVTYQKLKEMLYRYISIRDKVVDKIHDPTSIVYKAVSEDRRLKMTHRSLESDGAWREAEDWMQLEMRINQEENMKEQAKHQQGMPDSPTKNSRTSPREVATANVHLKPPPMQLFHPGRWSHTHCGTGTQIVIRQLHKLRRALQAEAWAAADRVW